MADPQGVTLSLDQIAGDPGDLLVRSGSQWVGLGPGLADQILTSQGAGLLPAWSTPIPGEPDPMLTSSKHTFTNADAFACVGSFLLPPVQITVLKVYAVLDFLSGASYKPLIIREVGNAIQEILYRGPAFAPTSSGVATNVWSLPVPIQLLADQAYDVMIYRTDGTPTTALPVRRGPSILRGFPGAFNDTWRLLASNNPVVTDALGGGGTLDMPAIHIVYNI